MAPLKINKNFYLLIFLWNVFLCFAQNQNAELDTFKTLSNMNQRWLSANGIPEVARLYQLPPYSFHSSAFDSNASFWDLWNRSSIYNESEDNGKCSDDLIQVIENVGTDWALQMLDSDGKPSSGILKGGFMWPGHYSECNSVYAPLDEHGHGDFHGQYCVSSWILNLGGKYSNLPLTVGLCVPDSCVDNELKVAVKNLSHILDRVPILKRLESYLTLSSITCKAKSIPVDAATIIYLVIFSFFILLTVIGSSVSLYENRNSSHTKKGILYHTANAQDYGTLPVPDNCINSEAESSKNSTSVAIENELPSVAKQNDNYEERPVIMYPKQPASVWKRILLCFSVFTNGERILSTGNVSGQLLSIHGIRFLSLTWVILGHTYISSVAMIGNRLDVLKEMDSFFFQMLLQSPFSVDSFFLLSGFLLAYLFLKEITKKNGKVSWLYFYIHRIWRLTPAYIIAVFFYMLVFKHLGSGPYWNDNNCDNNRSSWWKYFLYINNFIPIHQMCVGWSWYLANDMQFYIISPLFLYPLWRWPKAGFAVLGAFLIATWSATGAMSYYYDLIPMFVGVTQIQPQDFAAYEKRMWDSFDLIYDKPYCRIAPYLIGVILGYLLHQAAGKKNFLNWWQQLLGWAIASFCSLSVVFGLYHVEMSRTVSLFYNALCRSSFSIGLAWLIFACETGHGGFLTKFLSWKLWIPLSRLTYCTYLIHPMIIHGYYQASQTAIYFTELFAVTNFLGFLLMAYVVAFFYSLVFESPFMNLEKLVVKSKTGQSQ